MKATGIVRRIDDLGRVVIPKEIRRTMRIREGDPFKIHTVKLVKLAINIHPHSGWYFIFGHSPNTTGGAQVRF